MSANTAMNRNDPTSFQPRFSIMGPTSCTLVRVPRCSQHARQNRQSHHLPRVQAESRVSPDKIPEWMPPTDPERPAAPPEFTPPGESGTTVNPPPEYTPPEQKPNEAPRRGDPPMRPIRPEEEPKVPEPDSPFADPIRTPERREKIFEPKKEE